MSPNARGLRLAFDSAQADRSDSATTSSPLHHRVRGALTAARVEAWSDGSASERAGRPGGWAFALVRYGEVISTGQGASPRTTSLGMELEAATRALEAVRDRGLHASHAIELISDSSITLEVARGGYVPKGHEAPCAKLRALALELKATTRWVRGHDGHAFNEFVDRLASEAKLTR
jgi:ribonuclease HI